MKRRDFLKSAAVVGAAATFSGCTREQVEGKKSFSVNRQRRVKLKIATSWPANFPIMGTGVDRFAEKVKAMSGGSLEIKVYPKNILVPALAVFDATSSGQIDGFHSGPYYWKGKNPAFALFSGLPLGMVASELSCWMNYGGGYDLWRELYAKFNLYPFMGGNTGVQMGGWFRKPIESLADLKGLKMRIPGLGGEVMAKLGVNPILLPAGEIYTSLERGTIDATEWVGPALDIRMGFYKVAPNYYTGWHEPGSILELTFNKARFESLSDEHKAILRYASEAMTNEMYHEFMDENAKALKKLKELGVQIRDFPSDIIAAAKKAVMEVVEEQSARSEDFKHVYASMESYYRRIKPWTDTSEAKYFSIR
ncbi:TRAP transporter substrate-binding protein [Hydrogenimonas cancrithermarum]|uniref:C4-dicarboxylate ABC transporter n=1 Tax=Hydrogenimonas cancrithermarum TaxID=2993563 RepID=A0ABM8FNI8_9BACT|nr:TRAP transporter substrate-binding protein DctP [Hydrogenimonas cancrithermarum]BDY13930.1 C4-dicarboxylate ABC transporter [Hydrogenimonas cancrithermarum]